ncbi:hypothetical protein NKR23_g3929 [Pleurostoma richardsiae]|uniref:Uncharacterized protein n=1 Tax=Pleurostoma richardsiae TaxID=41990 RepID=A0AA38S3A8_9PEZI|nr:hypothetical protein NKR23_g3929 [Pleurostoma richardsiae]
MDGAAKKVNLVANRILPDRPHHLSLSPTRRYPVPSGFWQNNSPLQYSTLLSEADRGVLLTRPYYDIREEPETAVVNSSDPVPRPDSKKTVNKMSFKDYQKQKKIPMSPSEHGLSAKVEMRQKEAAETRAGRDSTQPESGDKDPEVLQRSKAPDSRRHVDEERPRTLLSKPALSKTSSPIWESKKRAGDTEDSARPQKRSKAENTTPRSVASHKSPRHKDIDKQAQRDIKSTSHRAVANGRSALGAVKDGQSARSPNASANGFKSQNSGSHNSTPRRIENQPLKQTVPPLLSPLRITLDDENEPRSPKKRPACASPSEKPVSKPQKPDCNPAKRARSPLQIPPLLSPTLPPLVEEALARRQLTPKRDPSQGGSHIPESPNWSKKPLPPADGRDSARPSSYIVKLKYRKKHVKTVQRILALEPASKKEARKWERSVSVEATPPPAKKRPRPPDAILDSSSSTKRVKSAVELASSAKALVPSTPSKSAAAMSRVTSGTSQAQTPGETTGLTPAVSDRPQTSHDVSDKSSGSRAASLRLRHAEFSQLGTKLKHSRDDIIRGRTAPGGKAVDSSGFVQISTAEEKRVVALNLEMILAYMIAFKAHSQARHLEHKPCDYVMWEQLQPHFHELKHRTRHIKALQGLSLQLNAICLEELVMSYASHENGLSAKSANGLIQASKKRLDTWITAHETLSSVSDASMRAEMGPWTGLNDAVMMALRIMRRWVDREKVLWQAEVVLPLADGA